ncbi:MAG TPA: hypothetical protein VNL97_08900 [Solirubrobacterales bacterium]|nr:hypothetical protein [Solirubrobacterales bacterium]
MATRKRRRALSDEKRAAERELMAEAIAEEWGRLNVPDPWPVMDGLLAATAKVVGLTLVTRNVADVAGTGVGLFDPFGG